MSKNNEFIGVDVSKDTLDLFCPNQGHLQVPNTEKGFKEVLSHYGSERVYVMETTGSYHQVFALYLYKKGVVLSVVNPLSVKRFIQMKLCRNKTDKSDSKMIQNYAESEHPKPWKPKEDYVSLSSDIQSVVRNYLKDQTRLKNKLHSLESKGVKAVKLIESIKKMIRNIAKEITLLEEELEQIIKENEAELLTHLQSIPGLGKKTAMQLISSTNGFRNFENHKQLISFLGLAPMEYSSGTSVRKQSKISKTGHPQVRNHLFMCSFTACIHNPQCKALYDRIVAKGKSKKLALIAVCNKLLKQAFAIAKSGVIYDSNYRSHLA